MLVITRKKSESISLYYGDRKIAEIKLLTLGEHYINLGVSAGKKIKIIRNEIIENFNK